MIIGCCWIDSIVEQQRRRSGRPSAPSSYCERGDPTTRAYSRGPNQGCCSPRSRGSPRGDGCALGRLYLAFSWRLPRRRPSSCLPVDSGRRARVRACRHLAACRGGGASVAPTCRTTLCRLDDRHRLPWHQPASGDY